MKKGISLIVLIITIVIMIILAGAIILTLTSSGIIDKARIGVEASNLKAIESAASIAYSELLMSSSKKEVTTEDLNKKLIQDGIIKPREYIVSVSENGINVSIPKPFIFKINGTNSTINIPVHTRDMLILMDEVNDDPLTEKEKEEKYKEIEEYYGVKDWYIDCQIDYGDGTIENLNNQNLLENITSSYGKEYTYSSTGAKTITITGICENIHISEMGVIEVISFGNVGVKTISITEELFDTFPTPLENTFKNAISIDFGWNNNLSSLPINFLKNCLNLKYVSDIFAASNITEIPENLFKECPNLENCDYAFASTLITSIPIKLFNNCPNIKSFNGTFNECNSLTGIFPNLWTLYPNASGTNCFMDCTGLSNYSSIPEEWK